MTTHTPLHVDPEDLRSLDAWKNPQGVPVKADELRFLYVTDWAEHMMVTWLAKEVFAFQRAHANRGRQITKMVMITMGALLPGVLLHDAITNGSDADMPEIEFGTFGVKFYAGPGQPLPEPYIVQPLSIGVRDQVVGIVEDLADLGRTVHYVQSVLCSPEFGARETVLIAPYRKSSTAHFDMDVIAFGWVPSDTWIITPRERVETMMKRVPYWANKGLTADECIANLRAIGYPSYLIDAWFDAAWERAETRRGV